MNTVHTTTTEGQASEPVAAEMTLDDVFAEGLQLHRHGRLAEAERAYRWVLAAVPEHVDALHFLGVLLHQAGFENEGIASIERALALCPGYVDAHNNLGNVLRSAGRLSDAALAYRRALELKSEHVDALNNLGVVLKDLRRFDEAMEVLRRAMVIAPERGDTHLNLGNVLAYLDRYEEASAEFHRAIELNPGLLHAYDALNRTFRRMGLEAEAVAVLEKLNRQLPDSPVAQHLLAAATGRDVPAQASEGYVRHVFDTFAESFDETLRVLEYRAPTLATAQIARRWPVPAASLDVLDAGCGTGWCGPLLRPYARSLTGVDLSLGMIGKARARAVYDTLVQAELTGFMQERPAAFDLVVSADTLVYFGDLVPVVTAGARTLRAGGMLVFTVEDAGRDGSGEGFHLHPHGRYSHREDYVRQVLGAAGLEVRGMEKEVLRKELGKPVPGLVVSAAKHALVAV